MKYIWFFPATALSGSIASAVSSANRGCNSMTTFWVCMSIVLFIFTVYVAGENQ